MRSWSLTWVAGGAGLLAVVLILGGLYLNVTGSGIPDATADAAAWIAWAQQNEGPIELGVYVLLFPGLVLFLGMFAVLAAGLPSTSPWTRLAGYGALAFFTFAAAGGVMASTSASTFGFYRAYEDPTAASVFTSFTAGYHFQALGVWSLALAIAATAMALRSTAGASSRAIAASLVLAALTAVANYVGFGIVFGLIWILGVSIGLLRRPASAQGGTAPVAA